MTIYNNWSVSHADLNLKLKSGLEGEQLAVGEVLQNLCRYDAEFFLQSAGNGGDHLICEDLKVLVDGLVDDIPKNLISIEKILQFQASLASADFQGELLQVQVFQVVHVLDIVLDPHVGDKVGKVSCERTTTLKGQRQDISVELVLTVTLKMGQDKFEIEALLFHRSSQPGDFEVGGTENIQLLSLHREAVGSIEDIKISNIKRL